MSLPKIMTVYGTRPEAIKVAPVLKALQSDSRFTSVPVVTGQHREMLNQVNELFGIAPKYDLEIMRPGQTLNGIVSRAIAGLDEILEQEQPDVVIAQGDTSTAMAAGISAFNRQIRVVHLEAGLRTGNIASPFPEEANRRLLGQVAALHLPPTAASKANLLREGFPEDDIVVTGNTVIDALLEAASWDTEIRDPALEGITRQANNVVLVTTHRRENIETMQQIGRAMRRLSESYEDLTFVLPAHLNPRVRSAMLPEIEGRPNIIVTEPLGYAEFTKLMSISKLVLTDSGGVQEEAPSLGKPVLVLRENTERPEAVTAGTVKLVGTDETTIVNAATSLLEDQNAYSRMANAVNPYGDGNAANRAVAAIANLTGIGQRLPDFAATA